MDCLFCKIINGDIPSKKVYEDELVYAFYDIAPIAPLHFLVIPKQHISGAADITSENSAVVAHIFEVIGELAKELNMGDGFRVITNNGDNAGQTVKHLHFHVIAGKQFGWSSEQGD